MVSVSSAACGGGGSAHPGASACIDSACAAAASGGGGSAAAVGAGSSTSIASGGSEAAAAAGASGSPAGSSTSITIAWLAEAEATGCDESCESHVTSCVASESRRTGDGIGRPGAAASVAGGDGSVDWLEAAAVTVEGAACCGVAFSLLAGSGCGGGMEGVEACDAATAAV